MKGAIVCDPKVMVALAIGYAGVGMTHESRVLGTAVYRKEWIDRYISVLMLETEGPLHVFNLSRGRFSPDELLPWASIVYRRLEAFASVGIIQPPVYHSGDEWVTPLEGLKLRMQELEWPYAVVTSDSMSDVVEVREGYMSYTVRDCLATSGKTDTELAAFARATFTQQTLLEALDQVQAQFVAKAHELGVDQPKVDRDVIERWASSLTDPSTCACLFNVLYGDGHPAFQPEFLEPLNTLQPSTNPGQNNRTVAIIKPDAAYDDGLGIQLANNETHFVVSFGLRALGDLLLAGVAAVFAEENNLSPVGPQAVNVVLH